MKSKHEPIEILKNQLAIEYNCSPSDFFSAKNIITVSQNDPLRRHYIDGTFFFKMVTLGGNAVISADQSIHEWLNGYVKNKKGHTLFEHGFLTEIEDQLKEHGKILSQSYHMFLSFREAVPENLNIKTKWFEREELHGFYETKMFPNALCEKFDPKRPDVLAVAAYDNEIITGMAGCSADTPLMWQIGIDVNENYRGKGIGTYLVTLLKNETERRGKVPFYGTSLSNLHSWRIALSCGFTPAWVEVTSKEN